MKSNPWCFTRLSAIAAPLLLGSLTSACLDRPLCPGKNQMDSDCAPRTTNVIVDTLVQNSVDKIDMLFVIDNSRSMGDKQAVLKEALPALVSRLVNPVCVNNMGQLQATQPGSPKEGCQAGYAREFKPITDINIGAVTSSLGDYTGVAGGVCDPDGGPQISGGNDKGWLLGTLARGNAAIGSSPDTARNGANSLGFLHWGPTSTQQSFEKSFGDLVGSADEFGCGFEATLESWYRFLIDPAPYISIVKDATGKVGPKTRADGTIDPDLGILAQRQAFLRPDSLVAVVMLTDENDCSFRAGSSAQYFTAKGVPAVKPSKVCDTDPNAACCYSCLFNPPAGCDAVQSGCAAAGSPPPTFDINSVVPDDPNRERGNLHCFKQKSRFGTDLLYPVKRYINALTKTQLCLETNDLTDNGKCSPGALLINPLFDDLTQTDPNLKRGGRSQSLVFLAGIVGVPWQDLAKDPKGAVLEYKKSVDSEKPAEALDWNWLLGPAEKRLALDPVADDALLHEEMLPRTGMNPALKVALAGPTSMAGANPINGHEWLGGNTNQGDLQYACIFKLPASVTCTEGQAQTGKNCDCDPTGNGDPKLLNPLCQQGANYGAVQYSAKAYPGIRELQVLYGIGVEDDGVTPKSSSNAIVASVCPKQLDMKGAKDYGYNPAVTAIVDRLKEQLSEPCLPRSLSVVKTDQGAKVQCIIVEASRSDHTCDDADARLEVDNPAVRTAVLDRLSQTGSCGTPTKPACDQLKLCEIKQIIEPGAQKACMTQDGASGNGWCYVDADPEKLSAFFGKDDAAAAQAKGLLERCPATAKRKLRWLGNGAPNTGTETFYACTGAAF